MKSIVMIVSGERRKDEEKVSNSEEYN